ncbi:hypothetical protein FA95DRAFT_707541 [Auriscalpium vulgare]|uniref:Uncharacterized protein n=1 Tax=Auriscalpium vulgare TaxID=40419 RepID=A0ACB8RB33_9AGAM|nr:hypothetical protein FA95DRAFT_707541 [Auriscalpium vulgare]
MLCMLARLLPGLRPAVPPSRRCPKWQLAETPAPTGRSLHVRESFTDWRLSAFTRLIFSLATHRSIYGGLTGFVQCSCSMNSHERCDYPAPEQRKRSWYYVVRTRDSHVTRWDMLSLVVACCIPNAVGDCRRILPQV